jgi:DNA adenine methylase
VCSSPSVTTRLGLTGIFLDPPYAKERSDGTKNRSGNLYANDKHQDVNQLVTDVRAYCLERGTDPRIRIALCGYESEGHEELETQGWSVIAWRIWPTASVFTPDLALRSPSPGRSSR